MTKFRELVLRHFSDCVISILDVGSYGVNGTYREIFTDTTRYLYTGLDVTPGLNVDYVPSNPYSWPDLADESFDVIISGQAFEHIEFPWLIIEEMSRVLKHNGLICIIAPSRGPEHKFPVDCWRYYPDGLRALAKWTGLQVLEAKTAWGTSGFLDGSDQWGDTVGIFYKGSKVCSKKTASRCNIARLPYHRRNRNNPLAVAKAVSYYSFAREEVVAAILECSLPTKRILEIGCADGATGKKIRENLPVEFYVGIEINSAAAEKARDYLNEVVIADIEMTDLTSKGLKEEDFELLLALDVLEHLYDPWDTLAKLVSFLKPGGYVVASIPNVQNISVLLDLARGKWKYADAGILDATHLRFFTREEANRMVSGAGLILKQTEVVLNPSIDVIQLRETGNTINHGNVTITNLSKKEMLQLYAYQYILIAEKPSAFCRPGIGQINGCTMESHQAHLQANPTVLFENYIPKKGLTSIVILTFNQIKYTLECVKSIQKHTPEPHEIIFVDNGSTDGTRKCLQKLVAKNNNYKLIVNGENHGFAKGCNQGIEAAQGEYILLLNNDVVVTEGWLSGLLECLKSGPAIGIVGPMTNSISGPQKVEHIGYESVNELDAYARKFRDQNRHRRIPMRRIVGFCMLFQKSLAEEIGHLDERFGTGNFEDDDYCLRAELAGYRNMIAGDVFIHHYGSRSFIGNRIDYGSAMTGNRRLFTEKWSNIDTSSELGRNIIVLNAIDASSTLYYEGKTEDAIKTLINAIAHAPHDERIYYSLAHMLIDTKDFKEASDALCQIPQNSTKKVLLLGYCKEGMELLNEAESLANQVLEADSADALALNLKGVVAYKKGDKDNAKWYFIKAAESDAGYGETHTNRGILEWASGRKEEGLAMLERGFILSPTVSDIVTSYYSAVEVEGSYERAEKVFFEAHALYPQHKRIAFLLIDLLLKQGKYDPAMNLIERGIIDFGIEEGMLAAALEVRRKVNPRKIGKSTMKQQTLSLCMIVKNEEKHIAQCLMSVKPVADEMIVVDTGSSDHTRDIATVFGAMVYDFPWTGDFSEARNFSLAKASGEWILVLDADEVLSPIDHQQLLQMLRKTNGKATAYTFVTRNYTNQVGAHGWKVNDGRYSLEETGTGWFPSRKVRLFPNDPRIRFEKPVHEFVEGTLQEAGIESRPCNIPIHHYGRLDEDRTASKGEVYYVLGKKKLEEKCNDPKALYELAVQAGELRQFEEAFELWDRLLSIRPDDYLAHFNRGFVCMELGCYEEALRSSRKALTLQPTSKEAAINCAHCELYIGSVSKAASTMEDVLRRETDHPSASGVLACAYYLTGKKDEGIVLIERLQRKGYYCAPFLHDISKGLCSSERFGYAVSLLELAAKTNNVTDETKLLLTECKNRMKGEQTS